jgi:hypothetical protein
MSVKIMSAIFDSKTLGPTERLVMLALADHADDQGRCYPSNARLCDRTGLSERAVRQNIRALESSGYLSVHIGAGQSGSNVYIVRPQGGQEMPPAGNAPGTSCTPPRHLVPDRGAPDAPKPSGTIKEPSVVREELAPLLGYELADGFIAHRKALKAPLTPHAARLLAKKLAECADPRAEAERSIVNGWKSVFPETKKTAAPVLGFSDEERQRRELAFQRQLEKARAEYGN